MQELLSYCEVVPHVLQIELHPWYPQSELLEFCEQHDICVQCYSPLAVGELLNDEMPMVKEIRTLEKKYDGKTLAQILLRWALQISNRTVVLPKSTNAKHIRDNIDIFDFVLSEEHLQLINTLAQVNRKVCWDPKDVR